MADPLRARPGKLTRLAPLLERYGEAIEADLAFRGWDLARLWHARRWRFILNILDHLPRDSFFAEAMANDDEAVEAYHRNNPEAGNGKPSTRLSELGLTEEILSGIFHRIGLLYMAFVAANSEKHKQPPKMPPWPMPELAIDRIRRREARETYDELVAVFTPHAVT